MAIEEKTPTNYEQIPQDLYEREPDEPRPVNRERWLLVNLMGNKLICGLARYVRPFGAPMLEILVPETAEFPAFSVEYSPSAIYSVTPIAEAQARDLAEKLRFPPVPVYLTR